VGVIPFAQKGEKTALLFVTSKQRGRWIFPKGNLLEDEEHTSGCKRTAIEEAGIKGEIFKNFSNTVLITKKNRIKTYKTPVTYYPMLVETQLEEWPEKHKRDRHWALLTDIHKVLDQTDYLKVAYSFQSLLKWIKHSE
jgi:diphosphoinositol-polyphosphate diphosphatase